MVRSVVLPVIAKPVYLYKGHRMFVQNRIIYLFYVREERTGIWMCIQLHVKNMKKQLHAKKNERNGKNEKSYQSMFFIVHWRGIRVDFTTLLSSVFLVCSNSYYITCMQMNECEQWNENKEKKIVGWNVHFNIILSKSSK